MSTYLFFCMVRPDPSGHRYITVGPDYRVQGGTKEEHEKAREITEEFAKGVKEDGIQHAEEILLYVVKKVVG